jgi:DNA repair protein RecO (recombination protein O)
MEWTDEGIVIAARRHGERDAILEVLTKAHGRHLGLVRGGRGPKHAPALQPGNRVALVWRARLEDHLGAFMAETLLSRAGNVLASPVALSAVNHLASLIRLLPERSKHLTLYEAADGMLDLLANPQLLAPVMIRFELLILSELGFGLDLSCCAATGVNEDLIYVSPKSGRAVCRAAGAPYAPRMLGLPEFLISNAPIMAVEGASLAAGFALSGYFLERHLFGPRGLAHQGARADMVARLLSV